MIHVLQNTAEFALVIISCGKHYSDSQMMIFLRDGTSCRPVELWLLMEGAAELA
jgi:hypothetical protein